MKKRLIIAEDDQEFSLAMVTYFTHKGYDVVSLSTIEAITEYAKSEPDRQQVFILDRQLKDGLSEKAFGNIASLPESRFLVLTAYPTFDSSVVALRKKAGDYLVKPISLHLLGEHVSSMFDELTRAKIGGDGQDQRWDVLIKSHYDRADITLMALHRCIEIGIIPSTTNIATMLNFSMSTVHRGAKDLFDKGMVNCEIDKRDRRVKIYTPTNDGKIRIDHIIGKIKKGIK